MKLYSHISSHVAAGTGLTRTPQRPASRQGRALTAVSTAVLAAVLELAGCGGAEDNPRPVDADERTIAAELAGAGHAAPAQKTKLPEVANPVYRWNELALDAARSGSLSDAQAARLYAMVNVAMYDAVNGIERNHAGGRAQALVPGTGAPAQGSREAAASAAARAVLSQLNPAGAARYTAQHDADMAALRDDSARSEGAAWGAQVGNQVLSLRSHDGSTPTEGDYLPAGTAVGVFRADWKGTQFQSLTPFAIFDPGVYVQTTKPALDSAAYAQAFNDVKLVGSAANLYPWALETYRFWASSAGTSQPPGEWLKVALLLTRRNEMSVPDSARLMALLSMGLADVVAPTYTTKYRYRSWRPATAIHEADLDGNDDTQADTAWSPRAGTVGSSPEYVSGHSAFAGVGGTILRGFFCNDAIAFTLQTDGSTSGARSYDSFSAAEAESGRSRVLGGVHFEFSNQDGLKLGHGVGDEVLATALLRSHGKTHDKQGCPN